MGSSNRNGLWSILVPALLTATIVGISVGISIPMMTTRQLATSNETYSVLTGIWNLHARGESGLAALLFGFSVVFPIGKMVVLGLIWHLRPTARTARWTVATLKILGKWSMLDFFVILVLAGALELGILASTTAREGVYVFGGAILMSMALTVLIARLLRDPLSGPRPAPGHLPLAFGTILPFGAVVFWRALDAPLMKLEKWVFWSTEYSMLSGIRSLADGESPVLAGTLAIFVVVLPALTLLGWSLLWISSRFRTRHGLGARVFLALEEWAMVDVFALAVLIVAAKISTVVGFQAREGLWLLAVTGILFVATSAWGRHALRTS